MAYHDSPLYTGPITDGPINDALAILYHLAGALRHFPTWDETAHGMSQAVGLAGLQDSLDTLRRELHPAHFSVSAEWAQACGLIAGLATHLETAPLEPALAPLRARVEDFLAWAAHLGASLDEI